MEIAGVTSANGYNLAVVFIETTEKQAPGNIL
jgi:hypothetical protein